MSETTPTETPEMPLEPTIPTCSLGFKDCPACKGAFPIVIDSLEWGLKKTGKTEAFDIRKSDEW